MRFQFARALLLGPLFFLICFGLGYPILNRYDPAKFPAHRMRRATAIWSETRSISPPTAPWFLPWQSLSIGWRRGESPVGIPLSSECSWPHPSFTAATAVIIIAIGLRCGFSYVTSLVGAMLFLVNFAVPNWNLAAYIDSGEAFFLALVAWSLLSARWYLLPALGHSGQPLQGDLCTVRLCVRHCLVAL